MSTTTDGLTAGTLVQVRRQKWVVSAVDPSDDGATLVSLQSVEEGRYGQTLDVLWEIEPGRRILPKGALPEITTDGRDAPGQLAAFLDAVRWSAVTSADVRNLQAPFRSGVAIEDYQLEPVSRAVGAPRVNLLLADDVGLGKTIEAGLVAQELLLRNRTQRIMIVCPAGLTVKWKDEMAEKFGLDFTVVNSETAAQVRREYGSAANPFKVYPQTIVSLPWLRGAKAQRLMDEVLPAEGPGYPRTFDLLILDEAHHVAPAAPQQVYAVDSQQTKLMRRLAPHFTHRLFLSATPHNGYQQSFTALLELLDDQRFARGVPPSPTAVEETVVRRLKSQITDAEGKPVFRGRNARAIPVAYPESEREIHSLLKDFAELRRTKLTADKGRRATDLVTLLLKKRLFSSPAAFGHTVSVYRETLRSKQDPLPFDEADEDWIDDWWEETAAYDDEELAEAEDEALDRSGPLQPQTDETETSLLERMDRWARTHEAQPDAKATELIKELEAVCKPDGEHWTNERVVVFTEYRDTQAWLENLLRQEGLTGDGRTALLNGTMSTDEREALRLAFQKHPSEHKVRILLATDAASEGIDLQRHCHRLINYDIPFNPNKLEQRIGRIDRYGQTEEPQIRHFVGTGWEEAVDSYEADLEFLSRVATKVARMEEDLGSINAVMSDAVQRRMLGARTDLDAETARAGAKDTIASEGDIGEQVRRLRRRLDETVEHLALTPDRIKRVVDTALDLANQPALRTHLDEKEAAEGLYDVPVLSDSWVRASAGLTEKLPEKTGHDTVPRRLPVTFDPRAAKGRDDVVLAHLNHPLVSMSTGLLRAAVSNDDLGLSRVTAVVSDDPDLEEVLVGAYTRFVLVGADGLRLHEEVLHAGGWLPENGRFRRLENLTTLGNILNRALDGGTALSDAVWARVRGRWDRAGGRAGLERAIEWRADTRAEALENRLRQREENERKRVTSVLDQFAATLRGELDKGDDENALFSEADITKTKEEREQYRKDRENWKHRLQSLATERDRELSAITERYADPVAHRFPVAVVFVVPRKEAVR
ncbi:DISARM system SNF2-like helicase DrmD [Nocardiopsis kunsanensis]|uniref:DISARM system SNF2-like helicase DrmD n=1 Tax=Nocardiopsis kunsanensis TaxID=141693 RepID=UPI00034CCF27|nr:DISARM system SNF2-like helicase DrmD [Nocardiopsis kunsanensis]